MTTFTPTPELFDAAFAMIAIAEANTSWRWREQADATWAESLAAALSGVVTPQTIDDLWAKVPADDVAREPCAPGARPGVLPPKAREMLEAIAAGEHRTLGATAAGEA